MLFTTDEQSDSLFINILIILFIKKLDGSDYPNPILKSEILISWHKFKTQLLDLY